MIEKLKKITSAHWLLIVGILFAFIGGHWSGDSSLVSHLALTASIVSIVLAIIAIFYTIERRSSAEEQIGRMNGVLHNLETATGRLEEKGEAVHQLAQSVLGTRNIELSTKAEKTAEETTEPVGLPLDLKSQLSNTSSLGLLCLNWIVKAKSSVKASSLKIIQKQLDFDKDTASYLHGYCLGTRVNLTAMDVFANNDALMAKVIPDGFEELLHKVIEEKQEQEDFEQKEWMESILELTDEYFSDAA